MAPRHVIDRVDTDPINRLLSSPTYKDSVSEHAREEYWPEQTGNRDSLMRQYPSGRNIVVTVFLSILAVLFLNGCGDANNVTGPPVPAAPGPLTILTASPLPAGATRVPYDITLAPGGGTPPYTWSLAPGSPALPNGLTLDPSTGNIVGTPTATGTTATEFNLLDSKGQSVQKVLSITVNIAPTPLTITNNSLPNGSINQLYAFSLSPTGGTTPYTWGLKAGMPLLPNGLTLSPNGIISGTPTVTSTATHTFTLTDATSLTVEKALQLSISAIPLSITTTSLPQGTANQNYSAPLAATGGTGTYTWGVTGTLPTGLTLNASSGEISGIPTGTSNLNHTFTVTDQTPPTPQRTTKTLRLIIGSAPPDLIITTNSLPSGTVTQPYNVTLISSGGSGAKTWDISSGSLPTGLSLSSSGVVSGTPQATGNSSPTFRVRDAGNPQDTATKQLSITINLPARPNITTNSLPNGNFNQSYDRTLGVTGGVTPLTWGVISGGLPSGLSINSQTGRISGTATATGKFDFTVQVTDSTPVTPQSDTAVLSIKIDPPAPPSITSPNSSSLPTGTVNQPYPDTQLTANNGTAPYEWSVNPPLPNGLVIDPMSGVIRGTPLSGSNGNTNHTFTVTDSTVPTRLTGTRSYALRINANVTPVTITTSSLSSGTVGQTYSGQLAASGGTAGYTFSINSGSSLPTGLALNATGAITGTPTATNTNPTTFRVEDSTIPNQQFATKSLTITINAAPPPLLITTTSPLPAGTENQAYSTTLAATGGTPQLAWSLASGSPALPNGLTLSSGGLVSGTPTTAGTVSPIFMVVDSVSPPQSNQKTLSITINAASMPLTITTNSPLPNGRVGAAYGPITLTATGGSPPYSNWSISPALPTGLILDSSTGVISGTPDAGTEGTTIHTLSLQDSTSESASKPISLTIDP